jgi:hypothetical protein
MKFKAGELVMKVGGSYQAAGIIVAAFTTTQGAERYVFEFESPAGMLHIFGPQQLEKR